jgi:L-alanine-DL-glutamate epimerase-like enolase superfamily enzyme
LFQAVLASDLSSVSVLLDQLLAVDYRVRCGVSSALFQALAQIQGKSIHELLSSQKRKEIPINCLISLRGGEAVDSACFRLTQEIERYTVLGITTVKCKGTADVSYDVGILKLLTAAYPECSFRLDPNGEWTPSEVVQHSDLLSELSLEYIEEPFSDPFAYKMLKENGVRIPIAFDHWGVTEADLAKAVERYTPVAVVIKCQVVGGPDKGACMVHIAENMGLKAVVTGSLETLVGLAVAAEVAACCSQLSASGILLWEYFNPNSHLAPPILGGMVPLPLVKSSPELPHRWLVGSVTI